MDGQIEKITRTFDGKAHVEFSTDWDEEQMEALHNLQGSTVQVTIKKKTRKRSLNANSYFWALCGELAEKLRLPSNEVYRRQITESGIFQVMTLNTKAVPTFEKVWSGNGTGWFIEIVDTDEKTTTFKAFYGSSVYNGRQMARLIDNIVQECRAQGIETMTPKELSLLKEDWSEKHS